MGTDIHMSIVSKGQYLVKEFFSGRNYSWFDKILHETDEYSFLDWKYVSDNVDDEMNALIPQECLDAFREHDYGVYGLKYVKVLDLLTWFDTYKPNMTAGWVRKIDAWKHEEKNIPLCEDAIYSFLDDGAIVEDWEFMTMPAPDDCMDYVISTIRARVPMSLMGDAYLVVYFDS